MGQGISYKIRAELGMKKLTKQMHERKKNCPGHQERMPSQRAPRQLSY
jgi:hypothetical protein